MREKNIKRAAHALYLSQGDDKNKLLSKKISDPEVEELVKDQGRVLVVLEKLILPKGKDSYTEQEMSELLFRKLKKKGHRIQDDDEEDDAEYAEEKRRAQEARAAEVPTFFGMNLAAVEAKEAEKEKNEPQTILDPEESVFIQPLSLPTKVGKQTSKQNSVLSLLGLLGLGLTLYALLRRLS